MPDDADTIRARIGQENADRLQAKINSWFGPDGKYADHYLEAAVRELDERRSDEPRTT